MSVLFRMQPPRHEITSQGGNSRLAEPGDVIHTVLGRSHGTTAQVRGKIPDAQLQQFAGTHTGRKQQLDDGLVAHRKQTGFQRGCFRCFRRAQLLHQIEWQTPWQVDFCRLAP